MELFLLVSMALTIVTFLLIVLSEPVSPSLGEQDSDLVAEFAVEEREAVVSTLSEQTVAQPATMAL